MHLNFPFPIVVNQPPEIYASRIIKKFSEIDFCLKGFKIKEAAIGPARFAFMNYSFGNQLELRPHEPFYVAAKDLYVPTLKTADGHLVFVLMNQKNIVGALIFSAANVLWPQNHQRQTLMVDLQGKALR